MFYEQRSTDHKKTPDLNGGGVDPIPASMHQTITNDNKRFAFDLRVYESAFFTFVSSLYTHLNEQMQLEAQEAPTPATPAIPALQRQGSISDDDLNYVAWAVQFLNTVLARASNNTRALPKFTAALSGMYVFLRCVVF